MLRIVKFILMFIGLLVVIGVIIGVVSHKSTPKATAPLSSNPITSSGASTSTAAQTSTTASATTTTSGPGKLGTAWIITDSTGDNVDVEVFKVIDPATPANEFYTAPAGDRLVTVEIGIRNQAAQVYSDDMNSDTTVVGSDSQTYTASADSVVGCTDFNYGTVDLTKGAQANGCVTFEIPNGVNAAQVDFKPAADFGGAPIQWNA